MRVARPVRRAGRGNPPVERLAGRLGPTPTIAPSSMWNSATPACGTGRARRQGRGASGDDRPGQRVRLQLKYASAGYAHGVDWRILLGTLDSRIDLPEGSGQDGCAMRPRVKQCGRSREERVPPGRVPLGLRNGPRLRVTDRTGSELTWLSAAKVNSPPPTPIASTGMFSLLLATRLRSRRPLGAWTGKGRSLRRHSKGGVRAFVI